MRGSLAEGWREMEGEGVSLIQLHWYSYTRCCSVRGGEGGREGRREGREGGREGRRDGKREGRREGGREGRWEGEKGGKGKLGVEKSERERNKMKEGEKMEEM